MASTDPELKDGFTLPVWMKSKPNKDFEPFARSPPPPEDSFFYIRYPKPDVIFGKSTISTGEQSLSKVLEESQTTSVKYDFMKETDWSKHTKPCQEVLHSMVPISNVNLVTSKPKPAGTDDGFKGDGAACGTSIVKMAHEIVQSNGSRRGFTVASPAADSQEPDVQHPRLVSRRGSKSLPASPAPSPNSSPTSRRKRIGNRYFTSPFEPIENTNSRSWLSMALLGLKKDLATSTSTLAEEDAVENRLHGGTLVESVENLGPSPKGRETNLLSEASNREPQTLKAKKSPRSFLPKPNEFREMNFWSPTSM